jgi:hypothetical protein
LLLSVTHGALLEYLAKLSFGEADLERFLFFNPLFNDTESNNNSVVDTNLTNAKAFLCEVAQKADKEVCGSKLT